METKEMIEAAWNVLKSSSNRIGTNRDNFSQWVQRKAQSLYRRDKKRTKVDFDYTISSYVEAICEAIRESPTSDYYTGEELAWNLIGTYKNQEAHVNGAEYKKGFAEMPTVDHVKAEPKPVFHICTWRTNDAKNDLSLEEFKELCRKVLVHTDTNILDK